MSSAIGIVLKIVVFLLTADEEITVRALSSLVFFGIRYDIGVLTF